MSTYTPIASQTLGSTSANVTFSSIPQGYTDLVLVVQAKAATTDDNIYLRFNSDDASNYSVTNMYGNGSSAASTRYSNSSFIWFDNFGYLRTSSFSTIIMNFQNYSNSATNKTCLIRNNIDSVGVTASVGLWRNTAPITAINLLTSGFATGSTFNLYGIAVGNPAAKAQGGNIVTSDGTYVYHTFTSSGSFIPSQALTADLLVVAGGGGGGTSYGGGGGAGGLLEQTSRSLSASKSYSVIIGAGGAGGTAIRSVNGSNSVFDTSTAIGGGGGGSNGGALTSNGVNGGSGGGSGYPSGGETPGSATQGNSGGATGYGFAGGGVTGAVNYAATGGGGGAGSVGGTGNNATNSAGNGGSGRANSISGTSVTYAGGGGGVAQGVNGTATGGGGAGGSTGGNGTANLGGGGGGANGSNGSAGGNGGSGIVIIRYAI